MRERESNQKLIMNNQVSFIFICFIFKKPKRLRVFFIPLKVFQNNQFRYTNFVQVLHVIF